jgi:hypothetical protein
MDNLIFKFVYDKIIYREVVFNVFLSHYPEYFASHRDPMIDRLNKTRQGYGFVNKFLTADNRFGILIKCKTSLQVNKVMETFYPNNPFDAVEALAVTSCPA